MKATTEPGGPFLAWPGCRLFAEAVLLGSLQTLWWVVVYGGADWLTGLRPRRVRVHLDADLTIPLVPAFLLVYRSLDPMFLIGPFVLRTRAEVRALVLTLFVLTGVAGAGFLLLPAELAYPPPEGLGCWAPLFDWNRRIVLRYNLVPSLHVALSVATLAAYAGRCRTAGKLLLAAWCAGIALSTLLTHQHHLVDVVAGLMLGWVGHRLVYRRWLARAAVAQSAPASPSSGPARPA